MALGAARGSWSQRPRRARGRRPRGLRRPVRALAEEPEASALAADLEEEPSRFAAVRKALVVGATGGVGRAIVERLVQEGVPTRALVRDGSAAKAALPLAVEIVTGDTYDFGTLPAAVEGCDVVFIATGSRPSLTEPLGPFEVDFVGVENVACAARNAGARKAVLVSSIGADDLLFPLNLAWGVLFWKKRGEEALQRSGLDYTIVRPGGLKTALDRGESERGVRLEKQNTFGLPPRESPQGAILRSQVADICVEAAVAPEASNKVVEAVTSENVAPAPVSAELFARVA